MKPHDYQWPPYLGRKWLNVVVCGSVLAAAVVVLAGCKHSGSSATLAERADEYWRLKQAKRWEEVYDGYLDPALKGTLSKEAFLKKRLLAFDLLSYTITEAMENGEEGIVRAKADANIPLRMPGGKVQITRKEIPVEDPWVRHDGVWYVRLTE
jgi:hypothetical protein